MKAYQAYGVGDARVHASTPREAALLFFQTFPSKRKCNVIEGNYEGTFFTVTYGASSKGEWPSSWKEVTKKTAMELPE